MLRRTLSGSLFNLFSCLSIVLLSSNCIAAEDSKLILEDQDWSTVYYKSDLAEGLVSFTGDGNTYLGASCEFNGSEYHHVHYIYPRYKPQIYRAADGLDYVDIYLKAGPTEFSTSMIAGKTSTGADRLYYPTFSSNSSIIQRLIEARDIYVTYKMANGVAHTEGYSLMGYTRNVTENVRICQELNDQIIKSRLANTPENATPPLENGSGTEAGSTGTCFAVSYEGHLVTNDHVISNAKSVMVRLHNDRTYAAKVVKSSPSIDLAILKIDERTPSYLSVSSSKQTNKGDDVFTIGFPVSSLLGAEAKYTEGAISSLTGLQNEPIAYQITVPIQPGNSGGPLINDTGQVVGVITSTAAAMNFFRTTGSLPQNVNWAVKSDYLLPLLELSPPKRSYKSKKMAIKNAEQSVCFVEVNY